MMPALGSSRPTRMRKSVVLPIPLEPTIAIRAPRGMLSEIPEKISSGPKDFARSEAVIIDIILYQFVKSGVRVLPVKIEWMSVSSSFH